MVAEQAVRIMHEMVKSLENLPTRTQLAIMIAGAFEIAGKHEAYDEIDELIIELRDFLKANKQSCH